MFLVVSYLSHLHAWELWIGQLVLLLVPLSAMIPGSLRELFKGEPLLLLRLVVLMVMGLLMSQHVAQRKSGRRERVLQEKKQLSVPNMPRNR